MIAVVLTQCCTDPAGWSNNHPWHRESAIDSQRRDAAAAHDRSVEPSVPVLHADCNWSSRPCRQGRCHSRARSRRVDRRCVRSLWLHRSASASAARPHGSEDQRVHQGTRFLKQGERLCHLQLVSDVVDQTWLLQHILWDELLKLLALTDHDSTDVSVRSVCMNAWCMLCSQTIRMLLFCTHLRVCRRSSVGARLWFVQSSQSMLKRCLRQHSPQRGLTTRSSSRRSPRMTRYRSSKRARDE